MDLEKLSLLECSEVSDASYRPDVSPLTGYVRKISMQPSVLWLACTHTTALENNSVEVMSPEIDETPAASSFHNSEDDEAPAAIGFVRYVEAVSAEPLEYWLCPSGEIQFPNTDETPLENLASENAICTWPESEADVASVTECICRVLRKPDSFWIISCQSDGRVSDKSVGLNSSLALPLCMPFIAADSNDHLSQLGSAYSSGVGLRQYARAVLSDQYEVMVNFANGMSARFEFLSNVGGCKAEKDIIDFNNTTFDFNSNTYFVSLMSKPADYWLYNGNEKLPILDFKMQSDGNSAIV